MSAGTQPAVAHVDTRPSAPFRVGIVGPLPPPSGGMANQCRQLIGLLRAEGLDVDVAQTNAAAAAWVERLRFVRAFMRLIPYVAALWRVAGRCQVIHLFANSGWAWHLCAAPALLVARLRGTPVVVNYRGGNAETFLAAAPSWVASSLRSADAVVVPSPFLQNVFARHGINAEIVPNIIDLERFRPRVTVASRSPCILVARNLEPIYDVATALRAFAIVRERQPSARMVVAGSGPERERLEALAAQLGLTDAVKFAGRIDNAQMPTLYGDADVALNPSTVDNMPISLLEAFASGVPVVSTDVGGVRFIARHNETALLVPAGDARAMAHAIISLLADRALYKRLRDGASNDVQRYGWDRVREAWFSCYRRCAAKAVRATA